ncbi:N-acetyltransferase [Chryseobacterium joostei]|uniref:N-acetyltransferase n=1 Tax=Chryseobacterium joostei TaxID=112234 RepID=A0A1N7I0S8_9FLAO|nr:GNAT family N-acetyltransferase [Chryseobacterium joostei]AZA99380.1 N-acetyltransferase [Chryseobacterium joostei]SIS30673.1 ribosomal-protein-alanine N-acetyltransferase [Chryseobacterium joostei]SIS46585.1 ribosomal-protein-alanine N-acetyltransferase [Chryseobacterium joostei]
MLEINFSVFPELETDRLKLRRADVNDINELFAMRSDPDMMKYIPRPLATDLEEASTHLKIMDEKITSNEMINWAITLKDDPKMIGTIGYYHIKPEHYRAEIGYMLLPDYQGKGYVTEAITKVVNYAFTTMNLHSIEAVIDPENVASAKVLEKCNFIKESYFKENEFYNGQFLDTIIYSILNK